MADCACVNPLCDHGKGKRTRKAMSLPGSKGLCSYCFTHCRSTNNTEVVYATANAGEVTIERNQDEGTCDCECWRCREGFGHCHKGERYCFL